MVTDFDKLYESLGYQFSDKKLLLSALTHRSIKGNNNERLEFLGDSIINFVVAQALFERHPAMREGSLSRLRANLVNRDTLAKVATDLTLSDFLILSPSEKRAGGHKRDSILSDAFEAVVAAIYLDSNFERCQALILTFFGDYIEQAGQRPNFKDPKSRLQEWVQGKKYPLPEYIISKTEGKAHAQVFHVTCRIPGMKQTTLGEGLNRRNAEQKAAKAFLELIGKHE